MITMMKLDKRSLVSAYLALVVTTSGLVNMGLYSMANAVANAASESRKEEAPVSVKETSAETQSKATINKETVVPSTKKVIANCSAYTADPAECGGNDTGITASGNKAVEGRTIAMDDVPLGTKVIIYGKEYVVEDRFGGNYKDRIDIYFDNKEDALDFGRQYVEVEIVAM